MTGKLRLRQLAGQMFAGLGSELSMQLFYRMFEMLKGAFVLRRKPTSTRNLLGMYFGESNSGGRRKSNRDRA